MNDLADKELGRALWNAIRSHDDATDAFASGMRGWDLRWLIVLARRDHAVKLEYCVGHRAADIPNGPKYAGWLIRAKQRLDASERRYLAALRHRQFAQHAGAV